MLQSFTHLFTWLFLPYVKVGIGFFVCRYLQVHLTSMYYRSPHFRLASIVLAQQKKRSRQNSVSFKLSLVKSTAKENILTKQCKKCSLLACLHVIHAQCNTFLDLHRKPRATACQNFLSS